MHEASCKVCLVGLSEDVEKVSTELCSCLSCIDGVGSWLTSLIELFNLLDSSDMYPSDILSSLFLSRFPFCALSFDETALFSMTQTPLTK